jgi:hypothetical protein
MAPDDSAVGTSIDNARAAIIQIDSLYKRAHGISGVADGVLDAALSTKTDQARDLLDGYCTIINMFITGWREALPDHEMDVLSGLIPVMISRFRRMTTTVVPSTIPTMAAMMTAAAIDVSPNLWRAQFGDWQSEEIPALRTTAVLLAETVNNAHGDVDAALRFIMDALAKAENA